MGTHLSGCVLYRDRARPSPGRYSRRQGSRLDLGVLWPPRGAGSADPPGAGRPEGHARRPGLFTGSSHDRLRRTRRIRRDTPRDIVPEAVFSDRSEAFDRRHRLGIPDRDGDL